MGTGVRFCACLAQQFASAPVLFEKQVCIPSATRISFQEFEHKFYMSGPILRASMYRASCELASIHLPMPRLRISMTRPLAVMDQYVFSEKVIVSNIIVRHQGVAVAMATICRFGQLLFLSSTQTVKSQLMRIFLHHQSQASS